jgi:hypothetical protein
MRLATNNDFSRILNLSILLNLVGSYSNKFKALTQLFKGDLNSVMPSRFTLENGEAFRVPQAYREFQVLSGVAWLTVGNKDVILRSGEKASLESQKNVAVISALGKMPLILEVF